MRVGANCDTWHVLIMKVCKKMGVVGWGVEALGYLFLFFLFNTFIFDVKALKLHKLTLNLYKLFKNT